MIMLAIAFILLIILYVIQTWRVGKWKWNYERLHKTFKQLDKSK